MNSTVGTIRILTTVSIILLWIPKTIFGFQILFNHSCKSFIFVLEKSVSYWLSIIAYFSNQRDQIIQSSKEKVLMRKNGHVSFTPGGKIELSCAKNPTQFPFDYQVTWEIYLFWKTTNCQLFNAGMSLATSK